MINVNFDISFHFTHGPKQIFKKLRPDFFSPFSSEFIYYYSTFHLQDFNTESNTNATDNKQVIPKSAGTSPDSELEQIPKKTAFQRSISEYVSDDDQSNERNYGKLSGRRRNNSGGVTGETV